MGLILIILVIAAVISLLIVGARNANKIEKEDTEITNEVSNTTTEIKNSIDKI